jgi:RimJ/RimL family protein N-acetyltransferase
MLQSDKVTLRAIERSDLATIAKWRSVPSAYEYFFEYLPIPLAQQEKWYEQQLINRDEINFAVDDNSGLIGTASIYQIDRRNRRAEWGRIVIGDENKRGQGIGKEILGLLIEYAFDHLNMHKLYCEVAAQNVSAIEVYKKLGFQQDGLLRDHVFKGGVYIDVLVMSLLEDTYRTMKRSFV